MCISWCLLAAAGAAMGQPSPFWAGMDRGPHRVGYELVEGRDHSRPFRGTEEAGADQARPVSMSVWYPADDSADGQSVRFRRYVEANRLRGASGALPPSEDERVRAELAKRLDLSEGKLPRVLDADTAAWEGATRAEGRFPLLIFSTGLRAPSYLHTVLCELLASHGYIAVAIPSLPGRLNESPSYDARAVETQIRDMEFVIESLHDYPRVDIERIGLVAWSLGGVSQALLQMKRPDVHAVVSLDAATGYEYGHELLRDSIHFDERRAKAPFLHITDSTEAGGPVAKSFDYVRSIARGRSYLMTIAGMGHGEFTSLASVIPHSVVPRNGSAEILRRYQILCVYVREFLDASLQEDEAAKRFLDVEPARHGYTGAEISTLRR